MKLTGPTILDKRITIQYPTKVSDDMGGDNSTWVNYKTVWAKRTAHRTDEAVKSMKETGTLIVNWRIRFRGNIRTSWRIKWGNIYGNIIGPPIEVDNGPGRHWLDITVEEA